jgi:hypothetical protein
MKLKQDVIDREVVTYFELKKNMFNLHLCIYFSVCIAWRRSKNPHTKEIKMLPEDIRLWKQMTYLSFIFS